MIRRHDRAMPPGVRLADGTASKKDLYVAGSTVFCAIPWEDCAARSRRAFFQKPNGLIMRCANMPINTRWR